MTQLEYLTDSYLLSSSATIMRTGNNDIWNYIVLDKTIFYPQWWGQPSDTWTISYWNMVLPVTHVRLHTSNEVFHYIQWECNIPTESQVQLQVDETNRLFNIRNHSAWHLIDVAIEHLGYTQLIPNRGHHFPDWSYVWYEWSLEPEEREILLQALQQEINKLITQDIPMTIDYQDLPDWTIPTKNIIRTAHFEGYKWCWCWGTHVRSSWEIGHINIKKISSKKWNVKISYEV